MRRFQSEHTAESLAIILSPASSEAIWENVVAGGNAIGLGGGRCDHGGQKGNYKAKGLHGWSL